MSDRHGCKETQQAACDTTCKVCLPFSSESRMHESFSPNGNFIRKEVPGFDAIRGIAILLVMAAHAGFGPEQAFSLYPPGVLGVDIFMVLSGFLIVSALLKDFELCGAIRFKKFYVRRAARIFPALFSLLLTCWAISIWFRNLISHETVTNAGFGALTFSLNLAMVSSCTLWQPLVHLWSLSLEEQFYLILPITLAFLLRVRSSAVWVGVALIPIVISLLTRLQGCLMENATDVCWNIKLAHGSATHFIGQGVGAAFGCLWRFGWVDVNSARIRNSAKAAILTGLLYFSVSGFVSVRSSCIGLELVCLFALGLIVVSMNSDTTPIKKMLNNRFLQYSGKVSFGLYLWHIPTLWIVAALVPVPRLAGAGLAILASYAVATISYHFLEVPVLKTAKGTLR